MARVESQLFAGRCIMFVIVGALALGGCASRREQLPSLKDTHVAAPASALKALDCGGRHRDREACRAPGGAATLEQKQADDHVCAKEYRDPGYLPRP